MRANDNRDDPPNLAACCKSGRPQPPTTIDLNPDDEGDGDDAADTHHGADGDAMTEWPSATASARPKCCAHT